MVLSKPRERVRSGVLSPIFPLESKMVESLICFVCGQYHPLEKLEAHIEECKTEREKKIEVLKSHLPSETKIPNLEAPTTRSMPTNPDNLEEINKYNDEAMECFQKGFIHCVKCGRGFRMDRIEVHLRNCNSNGPAKQAEQLLKKEEKEKKQMIVCYLCGEDYSLKNIASHLKLCLIAREGELEKMPLQLKKTMDEPKAPLLSIPLNANDMFYLDRYNQQARHIFQKAHVKCKYCDVLFHFSQWEKHQKSCRPYSSPGSSKHKPSPLEKRSNSADSNLFFSFKELKIY
jgi:hypothetical protein